MTRRSHYHDFLSATGDPVYRISFDCNSSALREAIRIAGEGVPVDAAFTPFGGKGEAFDPPEVTPQVADPVGSQPPNCDGHSGYTLAHAQHEAAEGGDECTGTACLITRGSD